MVSLHCCFGFLERLVVSDDRHRAPKVESCNSQDKLWQQQAEQNTHLPLVVLNFSPNVKVLAHAMEASTETGDDSTSKVGGDSTGLFPWRGGLLLAAWIAQIERFSMIQGCRIIELGCGGAAMPSLAASKHHPAHLRATDGFMANVSAARSVFAANSMPQACASQHFHWGDDDADMDFESWDVVLFADVLYRDGSAQVLAKTIARLLSPDGVVIGAMCLHRCPSAAMFQEMRQHGFAAMQLPLTDNVLSATRAAAISLGCAAAGGRFEMSLDASRNKCILVQWVRCAGGSTQQVGADMSEELFQQFCNVSEPMSPSEEQLSSSWVPTE
eukprot:TRINITY_DN108119_c0_g1_i1.p1 TRINITY_DN108119_c0_g1~~TRINITY_DN108119_c0_g1_i1.p1  ORF type:complete len:336 (+),score=46.82 TRINITY_DN108119_c0_g1_i1:25-1008(+)